MSYMDRIKREIASFEPLDVMRRRRPPIERPEEFLRILQTAI